MKSKNRSSYDVSNYEGFPIDTGTVVAQKLINPDNRFMASMLSCNMYAEKQETMAVGASTPEH